MTGLSLVVLTVLFAASLASWHPDISARLEREPWWLVAGAPAAALGLAAALMASGSGDAGGWVRGTVFVLTVGVSVAGGRAVTLAVLRGAEGSGVPNVLDPAEHPQRGEDGSGTDGAATGPSPAAVAPPSEGADTPAGDTPAAQGLAEKLAENGRTRVATSEASSPVRDDATLAVRPSTRDQTQAAHGDTTVLKGGTWIGALERAAVTASLLTGLTEGIVVVLAVKGLGRYPELRAPGAAERFIIGTFTSLLWAASAAGVGLLAG